MALWSGVSGDGCAGSVMGRLWCGGEGALEGISCSQAVLERVKRKVKCALKKKILKLRWRNHI